MKDDMTQALELLGKTTVERNKARAALERLRKAVEQTLKAHKDGVLTLEPLREVLDELEA